MENFSKLHFDLLSIPARSDRIKRLSSYFNSVTDERDRRWAERLIRNTGTIRFINYGELRICTSRFTKLPLWLIEESIKHTGNVTDAISLIVRNKSAESAMPLHMILDWIHLQTDALLENKFDFIEKMWKSLPQDQLHIFNRIITGNYRPPVAETEIDRVLYSDTGIELNDVDAGGYRFTIKAALIYTSQIDYTFAVWDREMLIPIVKTRDGIVAEEHLLIRRYASKNIRERFGPVNSINPGLIYEISFEKVERTKRRKSGVKLISPRVVKRCDDVSLESVDHLERVQSFITEE